MFVAVSVCWLASFFAADSQAIQSIFSGAPLPIAVWKPLGYDNASNASLPLIVWVHGAGEKGGLGRGYVYVPNVPWGPMSHVNRITAATAWFSEQPLALPPVIARDPLSTMCPGPCAPRGTSLPK